MNDALSLSLVVVWMVGAMGTGHLWDSGDDRPSMSMSLFPFMFCFTVISIMWPVSAPVLLAERAKQRRSLAMVEHPPAKIEPKTPLCVHAGTPVRVDVAKKLSDAGVMEPEWHWVCPGCWASVPAPPPPEPQDNACAKCKSDCDWDEDERTWFCEGCGVRLTDAAAARQREWWTYFHMPRDWPCTQMNDCECRVCWVVVKTHREQQHRISTLGGRQVHRLERLEKRPKRTG